MAHYDWNYQTKQVNAEIALVEGMLDNGENVPIAVMEKLLNDIKSVIETQEFIAKEGPRLARFLIKAPLKRNKEIYEHILSDTKNDNILRLNNGFYTKVMIIEG